MLFRCYCSMICVLLPKWGRYLSIWRHMQGVGCVVFNKHLFSSPNPLEGWIIATKPNRFTKVISYRRGRGKSNSSHFTIHYLVGVRGPIYLLGDSYTNPSLRISNISWHKPDFYRENFSSAEVRTVDRRIGEGGVGLGNSSMTSHAILHVWTVRHARVF